MKELEIGYETVEIDKVYGPTIFAPLRITPDPDRACWIIERLWIGKEQWAEWVTIPAQIPFEFNKDGE